MSIVVQRERLKLVTLAGALLAFSAGSAAAAPFLGSANDFVVLGLNNGSVIINSATSIEGDVGYSSGVTSGTNQKIDSFVGSAFVHSNVNDFTYTAATYAPTGGIHPVPPIPPGSDASVDAKLDQANADVAQAIIDIGTLAIGLSLGAIDDDDNPTVNAMNGLDETNVVSISSLNVKEDTFTIKGDAGDVFVFIVSGNWDWASSEIVLDGVDLDNVLFYFSGASSVKFSKEETVFAGTIFAPIGSVEYHNPATFTGRIIAQDIDLHSDFNISAPASQEVIVPPALSMFGLSLLALGVVVRRRRTH
mgnify:CR=1 FL=1